MNLCSEGHDEVCYEGRNCPVCDLKDQLDSMEDDAIKWEQKYEEALKIIQELNNKE
jgi:hypothetical protein